MADLDSGVLGTEYLPLGRCDTPRAAGGACGGGSTLSMGLCADIPRRGYPPVDHNDKNTHTL